jgi:hypothetical protein
VIEFFGTREHPRGPLFEARRIARPVSWHSGPKVELSARTTRMVEMIDRPITLL